MAYLAKKVIVLSPKLLAIERDIAIRRTATFWDDLSAKYRKLRYGSERPRPEVKPDVILEEMWRTNPVIVPYEKRDSVKEDYMRKKSHDARIEKNKKIRKLTTKITGGRFGMNDFDNQW